MDTISKIESHFNTKLPKGYCDWWSKSYLDYNNQENYLWVFEAEWIPPSEIIDFDLGRDNVISGLIPFAFTGAGDIWCWNSNKITSENEYEVILCYHDEELADVFAPDFSSWFYRNCLEFASGGFRNESDSINEAKENLRKWESKFSEIYSGDWLRHLSDISVSEPFEYKHPKLRSTITLFGFITAMEADEIIANQFGQKYLEEKVDWGTFL